MEYYVNHGAWNSVFAVPSSLVDQHIRLAGALQLKVLLWVLRHAGEAFTPESIAEAVGASTADVRDAMQYWTITGLLSETPPAAKETAPAPAESAPTSTPAPSRTEPLQNPEGSAPRRLPKPDGLFIAKRISESEDIAFLMQEAQVLLGRALSPGLSSCILMLFDDYGLPADVVLMLLQYAKSRGRDNTSYIESVGKSWAADGITSHERAEQKLRRLDETASAWRRVQAVLGIDRRSPSLREEQFASAWIMDWKFSDEMIREAYNRCIDATGKMKFSYMNKILEGWHTKGISTPSAAAMDQQAVREKGKRQAAPRSTTYDLDALDQMDMMSLPK